MKVEDQFLSEIEKSLFNGSFIDVSLNTYKGDIIDLKKLIGKPVLIKQQKKLSFTNRYKTKDIVKNYLFEDAVTIIREFIEKKEFSNIILHTTEFDLLLNFNNQWKIQKKNPTNTELPDLKHDRQKDRKILPQGKIYLQELRITDNNGNVYKTTQDKFKQINHYIELLSSLINDLSAKETINVVDMGSGKGYLTFALYDYMNNVVNKNANVTGVEYREDLVVLCNKIAKKSNFLNLNFVKGSIKDYVSQDIDVLVALHACDTATDEAIYKGIRSGAELIVVAPCCHKQIRREIEKNNSDNTLNFLLKYGVFLERQAEMVTDGIRALILQYFGYSTKVFEFISDAHTPKNVLIVGQKKIVSNSEKEAIMQQIASTKSFFGIEKHHLETLLNI